ncbi:restriction endonuclease [Vreelandella sp. EE7]
MELEDLSPTTFENLIFDLACASGLVNPKWRTPGSDEGRDIEGEFFISDLSGFYQKQVWYIECKRYTGSVPWPQIWEKISYAENHDADILLLANSSTITPQAQNQVVRWNESRKKPTIRIWNKVDIQEKLTVRKEISVKYGLSLSSMQNVIDSMLPLVKLMTKVNHSLFSTEKSNPKYQWKLDLAHSLTELLDSRVSEIECDGKVHWKYFDKSCDVYEWLEIDDSASLDKIDSPSFRAFVCYLKLCFDIDHLVIASGEKGARITLEVFLESYQIIDLRTVSAWSNFQFFIVGNSLHIEEVEN